jgi:hypothetical protein
MDFPTASLAMPIRSFRIPALVLMLSVLGWAVALVPVFELPFGERVSALDLASGSLSGGHWGPYRIATTAALVACSAALVWSLGATLRSLVKAR